MLDDIPEKRVIFFTLLVLTFSASGEEKTPVELSFGQTRAESNGIDSIIFLKWHSLRVIYSIFLYYSNV